MADKDLLYNYTLHLADNSMILGQRNGEWCGHGPVLEQDIALTNIALDLIGEARSLYQLAASLKGGTATEDSIAFLRDVLAYRNVLLVEQPNTDWAYTITRQFFYDVFHYYLHSGLVNSSEQKLAAIANKTLKEVAYHLKWSSEWMIRLGDGTDISREKMQEAVNGLWEYTGELFTPSAVEKEAQANGIAPDLEKLKPLWKGKVEEILKEATLTIPEKDFQQKGGKTGVHSEHLGYILAEMQFLQRAYPGAEW
jgi:ring-1,2-phenylacetyl-CoA epoxidase subunit PaaC